MLDSIYFAKQFLKLDWKTNNCSLQTEGILITQIWI
jgi:hypothetical protein